MTKKIFFLLFYFFCTTLIVCYATFDSNAKEILLRVPHLTEKNGKIISTALKKINGIHSMDACYELKVIIINYDNEIIKNDEFILDEINKEELNIVVDKLYERDIPIIRRDYKITKLISIENKTN